MSIFRSVRDLLRSPPEHRTEAQFVIPFGLTQSEWNALKSLPSHEGWDSYLQALDSVSKFIGDQLLQTSKDEALHFLRGTVVGIRKASTLIAMERAKEERVARERHEIAQRSEGRERDASVLFGSPGWRPQHRAGA
jgi:hypothetical protein